MEDFSNCLGKKSQAMSPKWIVSVSLVILYQKGRLS